MCVCVGRRAEKCATFMWQPREGGKIENDHECDGAMNAFVILQLLPLLLLLLYINCTIPTSAARSALMCACWFADFAFTFLMGVGIDNTFPSFLVPTVAPTSLIHTYTLPRFTHSPPCTGWAYVCKSLQLICPCVTLRCVRLRVGCIASCDYSDYCFWCCIQHSMLHCISVRAFSCFNCNLSVSLQMFFLSFYRVR